MDATSWDNHYCVVSPLHVTVDGYSIGLWIHLVGVVRARSVRVVSQRRWAGWVMEGGWGPSSGPHTTSARPTFIGMILRHTNLKSPKSVSTDETCAAGDKYHIKPKPKFSRNMSKYVIF